MLFEKMILFGFYIVFYQSFQCDFSFNSKINVGENGGMN